MRRILPMIVLLLCCAPTCLAQVSKAMEFQQLRESHDCSDLAFSALVIAKGRDQGLVKARVVEQYKPYNDPASVAKQIVDEIYDLPNLRPHDFAQYWRWECIARTNGIPFGTLQSVAPQLAECPFEGETREACLLPIRNQLLGLPRDYAPARTPTTAIMEVTPR